MPYTFEDLEKAKKELEWWQWQKECYNGNNPDKYHSQIQHATLMVRLITFELKERGIMELTEEEQLHKKLDQLRPNAKSGNIFKYRGKRYQIRYFPLQTSLSGKTVREWGHKWVCLDK